MSTDLGDDEREQIMDIKRRLDDICPARETSEPCGWEDAERLSQWFESWRRELPSISQQVTREIQTSRRPTLKDLLMAAIPYQTPEINAKRVWVIAGAMHWTWEDMAIGINAHDANRGNISEKTCKTWAWKAGNEKAEITTEQAVMIENAVGQTCATWLITGQHQEYPGFMEPFCGIMGEMQTSVYQWNAEQYIDHCESIPMPYPSLIDIQKVVDWRIDNFRRTLEEGPNEHGLHPYGDNPDCRIFVRNIPYFPLAHAIMPTHWWDPNYKTLHGLV